MSCPSGWALHEAMLDGRRVGERLRPRLTTEELRDVMAAAEERRVDGMRAAVTVIPLGPPPQVYQGGGGEWGGHSQNGRLLLGFRIAALAGDDIP